MSPPAIPLTVDAPATPDTSTPDLDIKAASWSPLTSVVWRDDDTTNAPGADFHVDADAAAYFVNHAETPEVVSVAFRGRLPSYLNGRTFFRLGQARRTATHKDGKEWEAPHPFEYLSMATRLQFHTSSSSSSSSSSSTTSPPNNNNNDNNNNKDRITVLQRLNCHHVLDVINSVDAKDYITVKMASTKRSLWQMLWQWRAPTMNAKTGQSNYNYGVVCERIPGWGLVARTDGAAAQQLDGATLEAGRECTFGELSKRLKDTQLAPSHGVYDSERGEYVNVAWDFPVFGTDATYRVFRVSMGKTTTTMSSSDERDSAQQRKTKETATATTKTTTTKTRTTDESERNADATTDIIGSFRAPPTYLHCVAVTKRFVIVMLPPARVNVPMFMLSLSLGDALRDTSCTRLIVIDRRLNEHGSVSSMDGDGSGVIAEYVTDDKLWTMHVSNAWDDEALDEIVIETIVSPSLYDIVAAPPLAFLDRNMIQRTPAGPLIRLTLPDVMTTRGRRHGRKVRRQDVIQVAGELPTINPRLRFVKHRYVYTTMQLHGLYNSRVRKIDTRTGQAMSFAAKNCVFDEPLFVANTTEEGAEEDEGAVLLSGFDSARRKSVVCVLDAKDLRLVATAEMDQDVRVPMAFHWYADGEDEKAGAAVVTA